MIEIKELTIKFDDEIILENINVKFNSHIIVISGENGSGKTTLLNTIYGLNKYDGKIIIDGQEYDEDSYNQIRNKKIKYVTQEAIFFKNLKVIDNLKIFNQNINDQQISEYLEKLSLDSKILKRKFKKCSGGEKQKILLINALLSNSKYLFLDEIDNNLDVKTINNLLQVLKSEERNLIIISHSLGKKIEDVFNNEDVTTYIIENKNIIPQKISKIIEKEGENKYAENIYERGVEKKIRKINLKTKVVTSVMLIVVMILINALVLFLYGLIEFGTESTLVDFDRNITLLDIPLNHQLMGEYGDETWLGTTPYYFTETNKEQLESLEYVEQVVPIQSTSFDIQSSNYEYNDLSYKVKNNIFNITNENLQEYGLANSLGEEYYKCMIEFGTLLYPKEINEQIGNYTFTYIAGEAPKDNSKEVAINEVLALKLMIDNGYTSIEDLVGKSFPVDLVAYDYTNSVTKGDSETSENVYADEKKEEFIVSGIIKSDYTSYAIGDEISAQIILPYSVDNDIVKRNQPWLTNDTQEIYSRVEYKYNDLGFTIPEEVTVDDVGKYESFYVVLTDEKYAKDLYEQVYDYDKYIKITNWYSSENTSYYQYISKSLNKWYIVVVVSLVLMIILINEITKNYKREYKKTKKVLNFYGYSNQVINKFIKNDIGTIIRMNIMMSIFIVTLMLIITPFSEWKIVLIFSATVAVIINVIYYILLTRTKNENRDK